MKNIGDYVIFRKDVCKIVEVKENPFNHLMSYTLIPVKDESLKLNVPIDSEHIRELMTKSEVEDLIHEMPNIPVIDVDDRLLENEYKRLLKEESHEDLVKIIKTTYLRNQARISRNKKVSDKDTYYFEMAEGYLYQEIATVLQMSFEETREYVLQSAGMI